MACLPGAIANRKIVIAFPIEGWMEKLTAKHFWPAAKTAFASACMLTALVIAIPASAQQTMQGANQAPLPPMPSGPFVMPGNQGGGSTTLELPTSPARQTQPNIPPPPPAQQDLVIPMQQLRAQPGYAQVTVTVTDQRGSYVTDLAKQDFKLFVDGQQRPIEFFRQDLNTPVSVGIDVDTSGSMRPKLPQARAAIAEFLRDLNNRDDVFLYAFSARPFLLQSFTTDHSLVMSRLPLLHAEGETAIYDTLLLSMAMLERGRYDKKALLLVTDGIDNRSSRSLDEVVAQARRQGVLIYSIGIGEPAAAGGGFGLTIGPFRVAGVDPEDEVDVKTLKMLSTETGAKSYNVREIGDGGALGAACEQISRELREQYTVGFLAPDPSAGGYRGLRVEVPTHPGVDVRVRKGVEVGAASRPSYAGSPY